MARLMLEIGIFVATIGLLHPAEVSTAENQTADEGASQDQYIDKILETVRKMVLDAHLDPAPLPDTGVAFSEQLLDFKVRGEVKLHNGYFKGLSRLRRSGPSNLTFDKDRSSLKFTGHVGFDSGSAGYTNTVRFMGMQFASNSSTDVSNVSMNLDMAMCSLPGCKVKLNKLDIDHIGDIKVKVDGLGPLNVVLEIVTTLLANVTKDWMSTLVSGPLKGVVQEAFNRMLPAIPEGPFAAPESA